MYEDYEKKLILAFFCKTNSENEEFFNTDLIQGLAILIDEIFLFFTYILSMITFMLKQILG